MTERPSFASDNTAPAHPAVIDWISRVNSGSAPSYGDDRWTVAAHEWLREQFGPDSESLLVWNGTGANVASLRAVTRPWHGILCHRLAHINVDECGAPELLTGCKLIDLPGDHGKLTPDVIAAAVTGIGVEHHVQPRVVSITQSTEYGAVYSLAELTELAATAHGLGLLVHMDGARLANAAAALSWPLRTLTRDAGVDILSFGFTKNGAMGAEAVVALDGELAAELKYIRKQSTQLASKMRYLSAQVLALAGDDLWLANAKHSNAMARRLADGLDGIPGITITQPVDANAVFAVMPPGMTTALQRDFHFYVWNEVLGEVRLMTHWATSTEAVDEFIDAARAA